MSGTVPIGRVDEALAVAHRAGVDRLDAQWLLGFVLNRPRAWLLAHGDAPIGSADGTRYLALIDRRAAGEPVAYLLGEKEFFGLAFAVSPAVLVPRPDTETLVEWALECLAGLAGVAAPSVLDLGTGSGAVALAIAHRCPRATVTAVDASEQALAVASANGRALGLAVEWRHSDWFGALAGRRFGLIVGNPPYVADGDPHLEALRHEPLNALVSGPDGLDALRAIVADAPRHLSAGGWLLLEHGHKQAEAVTELLAQAGFVNRAVRRDLAGRPRCSGGRLAG